MKEILDEEEKSFSKTLGRGEVLFERFISKSTDKSLSGAAVWRLYDTYGFPVDLTRLMAEEQGFTINEEEFLEEQSKAKNKSRAGRGKVDQQGVALDVHAIAKLETVSMVKTDDSFKFGILKIII